MSRTTNLAKRLETIRDWYHYESQPWGDLNEALDVVRDHQSASYDEPLKSVGLAKTRGPLAYDELLEWNKELRKQVKELESRIDTFQQLLKEVQRG